MASYSYSISRYDANVFMVVDRECQPKSLSAGLDTSITREVRDTQFSDNLNVQDSVIDVL